MLADLASCSPRRAIAVPTSSAPTLPSLLPGFSLPFCLHARLLSIVGQISDASIRLSASTTAQSAISFTSWLTISTLAQFGLPSSCVLADLASCSPRRIIAVPASSAPRSRLLRSSSPLSYCLHARLLSIVGQLSDAPSVFQPPLLLSLLSVSHPG